MTGILRIWEAAPFATQICTRKCVCCVCRVLSWYKLNLEQASDFLNVSKYLIEFWQRNYDPFSFKHLPFSSIPALAYTRLLLIRHIFGHVFAAQRHVFAAATCATSIEQLKLVWRFRSWNSWKTRVKLWEAHHFVVRRYFIWTFISMSFDTKIIFHFSERYSWI